MSTNISNLARAQIEKMEEASLDDLYQTIGTRMIDAREATDAEHLQELGKFDPTIHTDPTTLALSEDLANFGKKLTRRVNKAAHSFFCKEASAEEREDFFEKLNLATTDVVALLAGVLVAQLAVAPAIAGVVALAIVKILVKPGLEAACDTWGKIIERQEQEESGGS